MRMMKHKLAVVGFMAAVPLAALLTGGAVHAWIPAGENGFLLGGTAMNALDPENPSNQVIRIDNVTAPAYGTVSRRLNVKITALDNQLEFKSYFQNRSCGGGSPRIALTIDLNGDGVSDADAWAYTAPPFAGCAPNRWQYDDLTDELPRWDASQLTTVGLGFPTLSSICSDPILSMNPALAGLCPFATHSGYVPWVVLETVLTVLFPNH